MSATAIAVRLLLGDSGVTALVANHVFPVVAPQGTALPYLVVTLIHEDQDLVLASALSAYWSRLSVASIAESVPAADAIAEAVKTCLGDVVNVIVSTDESPAVRLGTATVWKEGLDVFDFNDQRTVFRRIADYRMRWTP